MEYVIMLEEGDYVTEDVLYSYSEDPNNDYNLVLKFIYENLPIVKLLVLPDLSTMAVYLDRIRISQIGGGTADDYQRQFWKVELTYVTGRQESPGSGRYYKFSMSTTGQSENVKISRKLLSKSAVTGYTAPGVVNFPYVVGRTSKGIEGIELPKRTLEFSLTVFFDPIDFNMDLISDLYLMTPCMNDDVFLEVFAPGEVMYKGVSASGEGFQSIPVTFEFEAKPNITNEPDPGFTNLTCRGWDLTEYLFENVIDDKEIVSRAKGRLVHEVLPERDFAVFGI